MEWIIVGAGVFSICGAVLDWEFFMGSRKAQFFVNLIGRNGARWFYGLLGAALVIVGVLVSMGYIER